MVTLGPASVVVVTFPFSDLASAKLRTRKGESGERAVSQLSDGPHPYRGRSGLKPERDFSDYVRDMLDIIK